MLWAAHDGHGKALTPTTSTSAELRLWLWFRRLVWFDVWTDESDDGGVACWVLGAV